MSTIVLSVRTSRRDAERASSISHGSSFPAMTYTGNCRSARRSSAKVTHRAISLATSEVHNSSWSRLLLAQASIWARDATHGYIPLKRMAASSSDRASAVIAVRTSPRKTAECVPSGCFSIGTMAFPVRSPPMIAASAP